MDGNFSAVHQKRKNAVPEMCLTDGHLYLVSDTNYLPYIEKAKEYKEVGHCKSTPPIIDLCSFVSPQPAMNIML
jgi:hypothetical protein